MNDRIAAIRTQSTKEIQQAESMKELDELFLELFGKNGVITLLPKDFSQLPKSELQIIGPLFNKTKNELEKAIADKRNAIREESYKKIEAEDFDLEKIVEIKQRTGYLNPLTTFELEIVSLFSKLGFQLFEAPQIDTDYYNFEVLNIPEEHPARDLWDTLYIDESNIRLSLRDKENLSGNELNNKASSSANKDNLILRTHTSNAQVRIMEQFKPPFRMMVVDRSFRYENLDARHEHTFDQFEIVYVDKGLSMANLQYLSEYFFKQVFGKETKVRLRPKYYPFVEPGVGVDAQCPFCDGAGCKVCGKGWLELAGAGMIHPNVLKNGGIDPEVYSGIAWGVGPERMLIPKYGISDIRIFRSGDVKFNEEMGNK